ncbi:CapA family protein [Paenibacillus daejeonensis]|uniref:CapA family protein n=1 Tax=Paenibacillus daejeonensis TaxID=135193 RepID=UPI00036BDFD7|nr:CapA family protein [Paenibacillus daejeonensis]
MPLTRSEEHQRRLQQKRKRMRRLLILNSVLLGLVLLLSSYIWFNREALRPAPHDPPIAGEANNEQSPSDLEPSVPEAQNNNEGLLVPEEIVPEDEPGTPEESAEPDPPVAAEDDEVLLSFVGDILLAGSVEKLMRQHGWDYPYVHALSYLTDADLTAGNLENPITRRGTPAEDKQYVFQGAPESLPSLREAGFDVVGLANNHTLDMGVVGLMDTMEHLDEVRIPHVGGGANDTEAFTPVILESRGIKVAYLSLSRVVPVTDWKADRNRAGVAETYDPTRALAAIKSATDQADLVMVMVHWGKERVDYPLDYQREMARQYIDAGADLVIGSHPHVLQGFEQYNGKWIAYSLGNFIFNMTATPATADTGVLDARCTRSGDCKLKLHPMRQFQSQPTPLTGDDALQLLQRISALSYNAEIDGAGNITAK